MSKTIVVVCGYGCNPFGHHIQEYLDYIAEVVLSLGEDCLVITSGGFTNPRKFPGVSEAGMMKKELIERGIDPDGILVEEDALTSDENLAFSLKIINSLAEKPSFIYIVCDSIRRFKVLIMGMKYFSHHLFTVLGFDFDRSLKEKLRQIPATIKDLLALYFPFIKKIAIWLRKRAWGIK